ncbi:MAG: GNAT family N-acetyltransferase [Lachnospiraceae bacterium]|nr:GNAT family N-acetyltransferase [Lachnospiraceae bacterium]
MAKKMNYRQATLNDIDLLVFRRLQFIEAYEKSEDYECIKENCYTYFERALEQKTCDVILAEDDERCIGTGIIFYYDSVPSCSNPTGKNAYITSLFVEPDYRGRGIAKNIMKQLTKKAASRGYEIVMLNASDMGKPLYEKMGFTEIRGGMLLDMRKGVTYEF